jgi:hypothetical protein
MDELMVRRIRTVFTAKLEQLIDEFIDDVEKNSVHYGEPSAETLSVIIASASRDVCNESRLAWRFDIQDSD